MKSILFIILLTPLFLFAQETITISEGDEVVQCGRILRIEGIYVDNGRIKADISILEKKNSKPIIGGYKMDDTIVIKKGCRYYIKEIEKYGLNSDKGRVTLTDKLEPSDYLDMGLSSLRTNDKFNIGGEEWIVKSVSKDNAEVERGPKGARKTITLKKNDIIWKWLSAYYISDIVNESTDAFYQSWRIDLKEVKDYSYLSGEGIPGEDINAPLELPKASEELIIRKMKLYPKQKFNQAEYDATPVKYWVLKVLYYHGGIARPVIEVERGGKKMNLEFDAYKSFDTEAEVIEFAKVNGITDIILEEK